MFNSRIVIVSHTKEVSNLCKECGEIYDRGLFSPGVQMEDGTVKALGYTEPYQVCKECGEVNECFIQLRQSLPEAKQLAAELVEQVRLNGLAILNIISNIAYH